MIPYINRTREVYQKLKGCPAQREVYDALDFHRNPQGNVSDPMTHSKLAKLSGTARERVPKVLDILMEKGLIQKVLTPRKYVFQYMLMDIRVPDVVDFSKAAQDAKYQEQIAAIPE